MRCFKHNTSFSDDSYCPVCVQEEATYGVSMRALVREYNELYSKTKDLRECLHLLTMAESGHEGYTIGMAVQRARILLSYIMKPNYFDRLPKRKTNNELS